MEEINVAAASSPHMDAKAQSVSLSDSVAIEVRGSQLFLVPTSPPIPMQPKTLGSTTVLSQGS